MNTSQKSDGFLSPSDPDGLRWMYRNLLPNVDKLYDELATAGIFVRPVKRRRGRPRYNRLTLPVSAVYWRDQEKRTMLEVGIMIDAWKERRSGDPKAIAATVEEARRSLVERKRLGKLARRYVKEGRAVLAQPQEVVLRLPDKGPVDPATLRTHFRDTVIKSVTRWLAGKAKPHCNTHSPAYSTLTELLDETSIKSRVFWLIEDMPKQSIGPR